MASDFEEGLLLGLLIGEGHFGGDGRQPHVTLRMNDRHEALFRWLERTYPGGRLYGPYEHGGRRYYQWMARGSFLREELVPILRRTLSPSVDRYAHGRFLAMCARYGARLGLPEQTDLDPPGGAPAGSSAVRPRDVSGGPPTDGRSSRAERIFTELRGAERGAGGART